MAEREYFLEPTMQSKELNRKKIHRKRQAARARERRRERKEWAAARRKEIYDKKVSDNRIKYPQIFRYLDSSEFHEWYEELIGCPFPEDLYAFSNPAVILSHIELSHRLQEDLERWKKNLECSLVGTLQDTSVPTRFRRRLAIKFGTPKWADLDKIRKIYAKRDRMNIEAPYGVEYQVDHIVPLLGCEVCGLHCEDNLRVLEITENRAKSNRIREVDRAIIEA